MYCLYDILSQINVDDPWAQMNYFNKEYYAG